MSVSSRPNGSQEEEEDDDYLTMTFDEPSEKPKNETLTQRKKRLAREAEARQPKSKVQMAEEERSKREEALSKTSVDTQSKGFKMMAALGYKPGTALGAQRTENEKDGNDTRLLEPIGLEMRENRSGIGADADKKRKIREAFEQQEDAQKKQKVDEGDFRERQHREREEKKWEGQMWGAMKIAERLDDEEEVSHMGSKAKTSKPLSGVNVLWRGLAKDRAVKERDRRMRYDLHQSLSRLPTYDDPDEEKEDQIALDRKTKTEEVDLDIDQEDTELEEFEALEAKTRLDKLVTFLREKWHYCFWCKYRYPDEEMEGCPGLTEDDHD